MEVGKPNAQFTCLGCLCGVVQPRPTNAFAAWMVAMSLPIESPSRMYLFVSFKNLKNREEEPNRSQKGRG